MVKKFRVPPALLCVLVQSSQKISQGPPSLLSVSFLKFGKSSRSPQLKKNEADPQTKYESILFIREEKENYPGPPAVLVDFLTGQR